MGRPDEPPAGISALCVWAVAALLLAAALAGGGCLALSLALPPADAPPWLPAAGLALVALPWAFWIATCLYRCCCSWSPSAPAGVVERQPSRSVVPLPSSANLKSALSRKNHEKRPPDEAPRRVRFGDSVVLGEEKKEKEDDDETPLASSMEPS
ncbi:uncharacterized protein LOC106866788 [Brachypodium distachyon]|uniref:Uncharacterized protein n=1 Tax=Brachypodium distachyon TaxID=15368 RepID=A0A0Q3LH73_BRADI|nr:uncharacterized protein LOC106866788 [Brachypodium distachyon]KQJ91989.1 hypothetical protein BRADI_4g41021v3 [Brachypodium distachyon]|eukprot:XP_014758075.1 uncharacterized protein LOC106866788 [Brachypodium distachyon]